MSSPDPTTTSRFGFLRPKGELAKRLDEALA